MACLSIFIMLLFVMKHIKLFFLIFSVLVISSCMTHKNAIHSEGREQILEIRRSLNDLSLASSVKENSKIQEFLKIYHLNEIPSECISFGFLNSKTGKIASVRIKPQNPKASILIIHGYLEHSLLNPHLLSILFEENYDILAIDLPGHGLSDGPSSSINDFSDYGDAVKAASIYMQTNMNQPHYAAAHSTGCSALTEFFYAEKGDAFFEKAVFLAPLVHTVNWFFVNLGGKTVMPLGLDPVLLGSNHYPLKDYNDLRNNEPLRYYYMDHRWAEALVKWNEKNISYGKMDQNLLVVQGHKDDVVDYKYNIPYLKQRFTNIQIEEVPDFTHWMANDSEEKRTRLFNILLDYLGK